MFGPWVCLWCMHPSYVYETRVNPATEPHTVWLSCHIGAGRIKAERICKHSYEVYPSGGKEQECKTVFYKWFNRGRKTWAQKAERKSNRKLIQPNLSTKILVNPFFTQFIFSFRLSAPLFESRAIAKVEKPPALPWEIWCSCYRRSSEDTERNWVSPQTRQIVYKTRFS